MERYRKYIVGLAGLILLALFVIYFSNIIIWILLAAFVAMIGNPLVELIRKLRIGKLVTPKWIASLITIASIYFVIIMLFKLLVPLVIDQVEEFQAIDIETISEGLEKPIKNLDDLIRKTPIINQPEFSTEDYVLERISSIVNFSTVGSFVNDLGETAWNLVLGIFAVTFISFFFLKDKHLFDKGVLMIVPQKFEEKTANVLTSIRKLIARYLLGVILETFFMMILFTLGLYLIGVDFDLALLVGLIGGVLNVIPYVGPWIGATVGIVLITTANISLDFYTEILPLLVKILGVFALAQITDNVLFQPLIYSKSVKAHPLEIFFVIIIAGSLYGILGMMLAIPGYTVIRVVAKEFLYQYKFVQQLTQNMSTDKPKKNKEENANI